MNQQRVFVVSFAKNDAPGGHLFIIDRFNGEMLNKIENIHAHGIQGVSIYENSILGMIANEISNYYYILRKKISKYNNFNIFFQQQLIKSGQ